MSTQHVQSLYAASTEHVRGALGGNAEEAWRHYRRYVEFVVAYAPCNSARILDVGCGNGWSTYLLREEGHGVEGIDLHDGPLEAHEVAPDLRYTRADAQQLPFDDQQFDVVGMRAVLEHIPNPRSALAEAMRVLRPGGRLIIVGPHLLSMGIAARCLLVESAKVVAGKTRWKRTPVMPRHPFGNTLPEVYVHFFHHLFATCKKSLFERPSQFLMRDPDAQPPFHSDNDACYFCNPMDLVGWARQTRNVRPVRWWALDRFGARFYWQVSGGTWVVLEKTDTPSSVNRFEQHD